MKRMAMIAAAAAMGMIAAPAAAGEVCTRWAPDCKPRPYQPKPYVFPTKPAPQRAPAGAGAPPPAQGFKPFKPYTGGSVYGAPRRPGAPGSKPCQTSVYVNACD